MSSFTTRPPQDTNSPEFWKWAEDNPAAFQNYVQHMENYYSKKTPVIRFIPFAQLKRLGRIPRYPTDEDGGLISYKLIGPTFYEDNFIIFVSHRWLQGSHPDDENGSKYRALVNGISLVLKIHAPGFNEENCCIWLDYSCLNQDEWPAAELQHLETIIGECDLLFTPLIDEHITTNVGHIFTHDYYQSTKWNGEVDGYLNRPWPRVEMMYSSHLDVRNPLYNEKRSRMSAYLAGLHGQHHRPHVLYIPSRLSNLFEILPFLRGSLSERFDPRKVLENTRNRSDREKIERLMDPSNLPRRVVRSDYEGERNPAGQRHGRGKQYFDDGGIYEGDWKYDKKHGKGKYISADGGVYEGDWKDGKKHGKGKYIYASGGIYEGDWQNDKSHGKGKYIYADGVVYEGDWKDDKKHGKGKYIYADGVVYEGDWKDDKKHGKGKYIYASGAVYEGDWKDDKSHGKGKYISASGAVYEGDWKDDKKHGKGKYIYADGAVYEGDWKDDKSHGKGKYIYADGAVYEGDWKDDKRHGKGKYVSADGSVYEGDWQDGKLVERE